MSISPHLNLKKESNSKSARLTHEGIHYQQVGEIDLALNKFTAALVLNKNNQIAHHYLGLIYASSNKFDLASHHLKSAFRLNESDLYARNNYGLLLYKRGLIKEAINVFLKGIKIDSSFEAFHLNLGNCYLDQKIYDLAIKHFKLLLDLNSNNFIALNNLGIIYCELNSFEESNNYYLKAIKINPDYADAYFNTGINYQKINNYYESLKYFKKSISLDEKNVNFKLSLAQSFFELNELEASNQIYQSLLTVDPYNLEILFQYLIHQLPRVQISEAKTFESRKKFQEILNEINLILQKINTIQNPFFVGKFTPFFIAYQNYSNKEILSKFGEVCSEIISKSPFNSHINQFNNRKINANSSKKIKLIIVSSFFFKHSVWDALIKGILPNLDRKRFEVISLSLSSANDVETLFAKQHSDRFFNALDLGSALSLLKRNNPDVIYFPEVGMNDLTFNIACTRSAPIQIAGWGHPETTGLKTIDYFFTGELFEATESEKNYSEILIKLPNLGGFYFAPEKVNKSEIIDLSNFGLDFKQSILLFPNISHKFSPNFDQLICSILSNNLSTQLVFFDFPGSGFNLFYNRLINCLSSNNLEEYIGNIKILPLLSTQEFILLMQQSTLYVDTIGFSGFNTAMLAVEANLPIATCHTPFLRGNLAAGILKRIGLEHLISNDSKELLSFINRYLSDALFQDEIRSIIKSNKNWIYSDINFIQSFENSLENLTRS